MAEQESSRALGTFHASEMPYTANLGAAPSPTELRDATPRMSAWLDDLHRLRAVIAEAQATRARTRMVLQRCETTRMLYNRRFRDRPGN